MLKGGGGEVAGMCIMQKHYYFTSYGIIKRNYECGLIRKKEMETTIDDYNTNKQNNEVKVMN